MLFEEEQEPEFEIFSALLFNSLKAITFMFFISFAMINKPADEGKVDPKAEMLITVSWEDNNPAAPRSMRYETKVMPQKSFMSMADSTGGGLF